jgi:hypothetical protein
MVWLPRAWSLIGTRGNCFSKLFFPSSKKFEILSWQLQGVKTSAEKAGLEVEFIKTKKTEDGRRWPPVIKRRILISGKKCAVFSVARISQDPEKSSYNYAVFKASDEDWPEFQLHIVKCTGRACDVFVIPRKHIAATTSASLDHPELARYAGSHPHGRESRISH